MFVCPLKSKHSPSCELPLTARKTVFSHLKQSDWFATSDYSTLVKSNYWSDLLSMRRSDWLCYYEAICYSPLVAKSPSFAENQNNGSWIAFCFKVVLSRHFWPTSFILLKQLFLSPSWAIDSEPIRARGIIVKYSSSPPSEWIMCELGVFPFFQRMIF